MRRFISLLLILFIFGIAFSQGQSKVDPTLITGADIDKKLRGIAANPNIDPKQKENLLLHLKKESEKLGYDSGIFQSGDYLMGLYLSQSRNKETADLGNQLKKITQGKKDEYGFISSIYRRNALALGSLGLDDASLRDFRTAIRYSEKIDDINKKLYQKSLIYENMTVCYVNKQLKNKKYRDSIVYYLDRSLEVVSQIKDNNGKLSNQLKYDHLAFINMRLGIFYLEQVDTKGSLGLAEKNLLDGLSIYNKDESNILPDNRTMLMNQLSWLYVEKKDFRTAIDYANRALVLEKQYSDPYHRVESFEFLASSYLEIGEKEKSKSYMEKYTFLKDSLAYAEKNAANSTMTKMVTQVETDHKTNRRELLIWAGAIFILLALVAFFVWRRKSRIMRRTYEQMIEKLKADAQTKPIEEEIEPSDDNTQIEPETNEESELSSGKTIISAETEARILKRLVAFERSERFLKKDLTIGLLSGQLNTNSKYMSEVIKTHKSQNFSNYLNSLRINYIIHKLYSEPKYREYKISYLAEACGYASSQVFVIAFKKQCGVTPSYFIDSLKEDQALVCS